MRNHILLACFTMLLCALPAQAQLASYKGDASIPSTLSTNHRNCANGLTCTNICRVLAGGAADDNGVATPVLGAETNAISCAATFSSNASSAQSATNRVDARFGTLTNCPSGVTAELDGNECNPPRLQEWVIKRYSRYETQASINAVIAGGQGGNSQEKLDLNRSTWQSPSSYAWMMGPTYSQTQAVAVSEDAGKDTICSGSFGCQWPLTLDKTTMGDQWMHIAKVIRRSGDGYGHEHIWTKLGSGAWVDQWNSDTITNPPQSPNANHFTYLGDDLATSQLTMMMGLVYVQRTSGNVSVFLTDICVDHSAVSEADAIAKCSAGGFDMPGGGAPGTVTATMTGPGAAPQSGTMTVTGTGSCPAHTCVSAQFKIYASDGTTFIKNCGGAQAGVGPYSTTCSTNALDTLDGRYTVGVTVTNDNTPADTGNAVPLAINIHNAVTPHKGVKR